MKTVFLDRDGVINNDTGYVGKWDDFFFLPGVIGALDILTQEGYRVIVVTNQSGIARGYYSEVDYLRLEREIDKYLRSINIFITATYYCPHHVDGSVKKYSINCDCRKPSPGMLIRASKDYNFDFSQATMIGDSNAVDIDQRGLGDKATFLTVTGDSNNVDIDQRGVGDDLSCQTR